VVGCSQTPNIEDTSKSGTKMANPAHEKCIADGYQIQTLYENGVPVGANCINPPTGESCEIWSYFRGECTLE
jgi:putative hemolysin